MSHAMSRSERQAFLAAVHVGILGITSGDRALAVPIWYQYEPDGDLWVITDPGSIKGRALETSQRYSLCAQTEEAPYKYVTVEGPVTVVEEASDEAKRIMAHRYLGQELGDLYLESTSSGSAGNRTYRMTPATWYTVDYAKDFG